MNFSKDKSSSKTEISSSDKRDLNMPSLIQPPKKKFKVSENDFKIETQPKLNCVNRAITETSDALLAISKSCNLIKSPKKSSKNLINIDLKSIKDDNCINITDRDNRENLLLFRILRIKNINERNLIELSLVKSNSDDKNETTCYLHDSW